MDAQVRFVDKPSDPVPTAVAILINDYPSCSGTILSKFWVLTAGQCLENVTELDIQVVAGGMNLFPVGVKQIVKHEVDVPEAQGWDLALLQLDEALDIGSIEAISTAVLPPPLSKHAGKPITVGGWLSGFSSEQQSVNATIRTTLDCLKNHPEGNVDGEHMFCANAESDTGPIVHPGSGAVYQGWGAHVVVGISSFDNKPTKGRKTSHQSMAFIKVEKFLLWIFDETKIK
jgi:hypothetical protein